MSQMPSQRSIQAQHAFCAESWSVCFVRMGPQRALFTQAQHASCSYTAESWQQRGITWWPDASQMMVVATSTRSSRVFTAGHPSLMSQCPLCCTSSHLQGPPQCPPHQPPHPTLCAAGLKSADGHQPCHRNICCSRMKHTQDGGTVSHVCSKDCIIALGRLSAKTNQQTSTALSWACGTLMRTSALHLDDAD